MMMISFLSDTSLTGMIYNNLCQHAFIIIIISSRWGNFCQFIRNIEQRNTSS